MRTVAEILMKTLMMIMMESMIPKICILSIQMSGLIQILIPIQTIRMHSPLIQVSGPIMMVMELVMVTMAKMTKHLFSIILSRRLATMTVVLALAKTHGTWLIMLHFTMLASETEA